MMSARQLRLARLRALVNTALEDCIEPVAVRVLYHDDEVADVEVVLPAGAPSGVAQAVTAAIFDEWQIAARYGSMSPGELLRPLVLVSYQHHNGGTTNPRDESSRIAPSSIIRGHEVCDKAMPDNEPTVPTTPEGWRARRKELRRIHAQAIRKALAERTPEEERRDRDSRTMQAHLKLRNETPQEPDAT